MRILLVSIWDYSAAVPLNCWQRRTRSSWGTLSCIFANAFPPKHTTVLTTVPQLVCVFLRQRLSSCKRSRLGLLSHSSNGKHLLQPIKWRRRALIECWFKLVFPSSIISPLCAFVLARLASLYLVCVLVPPIYNQRLLLPRLSNYRRSSGRACGDCPTLLFIFRSYTVPSSYWLYYFNA